MKKYKINKEDNNINLTDEEIASYKNFSTLRANYDGVTKRPKQPLYKNPKYFIALVIIIIILLIILGEL